MSFMRRSDEVRMLALANSFPTLKDVLDLWHDDAPEVLEEWACGPAATPGGLAAARFVLAVYNYDAEWKCGRFSMRDISRWDDHHIEAFAAWARDPFWP